MFAQNSCNKKRLEEGNQALDYKECPVSNERGELQFISKGAVFSFPMLPEGGLSNGLCSIKRANVIVLC